MPNNPNILEHMRDRQRRMFRIAMDPARYGLTLKAISIDSGLNYDSLRNYCSGDTIMPLTALDALIGVVPDELLSLLLPQGRQIIAAPDELDHDRLCELAQDYLREKAHAHHPESPNGRDISACEDVTLRGKAAVLKAVA